MGLVLMRKQPQKLAVVRQYLVAILASLSFACAGSAIAWPSPTLLKVLTGESPVLLDVNETSWMVSLLYLGEVVSAIPSYFLSDRIGRKNTLLYSGLLPMISWLVILKCKTYVGLYVARFLAGVQIGVTTIVHPIYISEVSQVDVRKSLLDLGKITSNAGIFLVFVVGPFVSYRMLGWICFLFPVLFFLSFQYAPESPFYILTKGDVNTARNSLLWLRGDLNRIELEFELDKIEEIVETRLQEQDSFIDLLSSKVLRKDIFIILANSALEGFLGITVIQAYSAITFPTLTFGTLTPNDCVIIIGFAILVSSFIATYVSNFSFSKKIVVSSYFGCSISMGMVAMWFFLKSKTEVDISYAGFVPFSGCLVHLVICSLVQRCELVSVNDAVFSSSLRNKVSVISLMLKATSHFILNKFYLLITEWEGTYLNFLFYSVGCLIYTLFGICFIWKTDKKTILDNQGASNGVEHCKTVYTVNGTF